MDGVAYTLDSAGHTYNPFTTVDVFGAPPPVHMQESNKQQLFLGRDDSALPPLANPHFQNPGYLVGSNHPNAAAQQRSAAASQNGVRSAENMTHLLLFGAVLAIALIKFI